MDTSDGWFIAPPIFSFSSRRKRENGPCTVQKRKRSMRPAGDVGRETRKRCFLRVRMSPARGVVQAGVLEMDEWTSFSFRCRSPGACARLLPVIALEAPPLIARRNGRRHKRLPLIDGPQERGCLPLAFPLSLHLPRGVERQHAAQLRCLRRINVTECLIRKRIIVVYLS